MFLSAVITEFDLKFYRKTSTWSHSDKINEVIYIPHTCVNCKTSWFWIDKEKSKCPIMAYCFLQASFLPTSWDIYFKSDCSAQKLIEAIVVDTLKKNIMIVWKLLIEVHYKVNNVGQRNWTRESKKLLILSSQWNLMGYTYSKRSLVRNYTLTKPLQVS